MEFQKIVNLLDTTFDDKNLPRFVSKKWIEVYDQSEKYYNVNKEVTIKTPMLRADLWDYSDAYIVVKGTRTMRKETKVLHLKIKHHLSTVSQKSMVHTLTTQKIWML